VQAAALYQMLHYETHNRDFHAGLLRSTLTGGPKRAHISSTK
jgi:hypothetical protein